MFLSAIIILKYAICLTKQSILFNLQKSVCVIYEAVYTVQFACDCGHDCKALYPCLLVNAFLNGSHDSHEDREWPIYVYDDDWQLVAVNTAEEKRREQVNRIGGG
jgi:hypothetical protein